MQAETRDSSPAETRLGETCFTEVRHLDFAALSGDWNPMHVDATAARRTQAGRLVVHGMHIVARLLEQLAGRVPELGALSSIRAGFLQPVYVSDVVEFIRIGNTDPGYSEMRLQARVQGTPVSVFRLRFAQPAGAEPDQELPPAALGKSSSQAPSGVQPKRVPREIDSSEITAMRGTIDTTVDFGALESNFPAALSCLRAARLGALISLSRLVGMECPGLHSMIGGIDIEIGRHDSDMEVAYRVDSFDDRVRIVNIAVNGSGICGQVDAFLRPAPVAQRGIPEIADFVQKREFEGQRVLIVGGSRGLGELTAKIISCGGGSPVITWHSGKDDAERVAAEIRSSGGECEAVRYDALLPPQEQLASVRQGIDFLYYFATSRISRRRTSAFDASLFREFLDHYVFGFHVLCQHLQRRERTLRVFYPSSVFVEERPRDMTEYAMAKAAGEVLCTDLAAASRQIFVVSRRLPRLATDQTLTMIPSEMADAVDVLLPAIREVQARDPAGHPAEAP